MHSNEDDVVEERENGDKETKVKAWLEEISAAMKREKTYREDAAHCVALYESQKCDDYTFNIIYSNTETLAPALYSVTPRPKVARRFKDDDPLGFAVSKVMQRNLEFLMDSGQPSYTEFDELMKQAVIEALVPGRGVTRFKYDAAIKEGEKVNMDIGGEIDLAETVAYETVCGEEIPWDCFLHGYAKKWEQVPWVCYIHQMNREELVENFGKELAEKVALVTRDDIERETANASDDESKEEVAQLVGHATVYEIWDKQKRKVLFISPGYKDQPLREVDDPLGLTGFFPSPRPLTFTRKISSLVPISLYSYYKAQAKELNRLTKRINRIVEAIKVRGFYDSTVEGMENLMRQDDNTLMPCDNVAALSERGTIDKALFMMPIEKLVTVVQQLYLARETVKQIIYEITGISDILRGSSSASESATAQRIKNEWGNLRLRRWQREVQRYARDCLRIMAEIASEKLDIETMRQMTGLQYPTNQQKQAIEQQSAMLEQAVAAGQMQQDQADQLLQSPQAQQLQEILAMPSWEDITGLMQDDHLRSYRIDIETNSTLDADISEDKENITEFVNAMSQFFLSVTPLIEQGSLPFEAAKAILMQMTRRFNFGSEVEDQLNQMQAPQPPEEDNGEQEKLAQEKIQLDQDRAKMEMDSLKQKAELEMQRQELDFQKRMMQLELQYMKKMSQLQQLETSMKVKAAEQAGQQKPTAKPTSKPTNK